MKTKIKLLLVLLLTMFLSVPTICNADETPPMKWNDIITNSNTDKSILNDKLYNINNDILVIHNSSSTKNNYIRLYSSSGKMKWEYKQDTLINKNNFLINNEYLGFVELNDNNMGKSILLLDLKNGKFTKKIDIENKFKDFDYYSNLLYLDSYKDKIIFVFYDNNDTNKYYFYSLDEDGNIKLSKEDIAKSNYKDKEMDFKNNIYTWDYIDDTDVIITFSPSTGEITNKISLNIKPTLDDIENQIVYKDGFLFYGSKNGYMAIEYYDLKNNTTHFQQLDKEGKIYTADTDSKDNLYIAGKYIDNNTTGKAYFSKYTYNNLEFQKEYESIHEQEELKNNIYYFDDITVIKNNKFALIGNTLDGYGGSINGHEIYTLKNFIVYYDGTKNYKIDKVIKGNGNLDIVESEEEDNEVKYQVKPGFGYKLISLKIVTESGKEIEVSDDYSFIMPDENITITAVFEPIINNPVTGNNIIRIILETAIFITFIYGTAKSIKKNHN